MKTKWYYRKVGAHVLVRVFTNGTLNGELTFSESEWPELLARLSHINIGPMVDTKPWFFVIKDDQT